MVIFEKITIFILQILKYINLFAETLPFIFCLLFYKRINTKNKKVFFLYTLLITILVLAVVVTRYLYHSIESYYLITRAYNVIEYSVLSYFFSLFIKNSFVRKSLLYSPIPFILFCIYDFASTSEPTIAFYPLVVEYLVLLVFIIYFFFEIMQENVVDPIYQKPVFWISVAFIINFSGNFFLFLYSKSSYTDDLFRKQFTIINGTITILKNILLCIAILIKDPINDNQSLANLSIDSDLDAYLPFKSSKEH